MRRYFNSAPHDVRGRLNRLPDCDAARIIFTGEDEGHAPGRCKGRAGSD